MVVHVSEIVPGEPEAFVRGLRRAAKEQATVFVVVCVEDAPDSARAADAVVALIDGARRGSHIPAPAREMLNVGDLRLDHDRHEVTRAGRAIHLSPMEYSLLDFLMSNSDRVVAEEHLLRSVLGGAGASACNRLWVNMHRLRKKVDQPEDVPLIHTIRGAGYIMRTPNPVPAASA